MCFYCFVLFNQQLYQNDIDDIGILLWKTNTVQDTQSQLEKTDIRVTFTPLNQFFIWE